MHRNEGYQTHRRCPAEWAEEEIEVGGSLLPCIDVDSLAVSRTQYIGYFPPPL